MLTGSRGSLKMIRGLLENFREVIRESERAEMGKKPRINDEEPRRVGERGCLPGDATAAKIRRIVGLLKHAFEELEYGRGTA